MREKTGVPFPWLRNSAGRADALLTILVLFSFATLASWLLGGSTYQGHGFSLAIPKLEAAGVIAVLGTIAGYVQRRRDAPKVDPAPAPPPA